MKIRILTEEFPQQSVLKYIIKKILNIHLLHITIVCIDGTLTIQNTCEHIVTLNLFKGTTSSVDYIVFIDDNKEPSLLIESTKTTDIESRNTSAYQRLIKFIVAKHYYPSSEVIMFYEGKFTPTLSKTMQFGIRLMKTIGVHIIGANGDELFKTILPFANADELIKNKMDMNKKKHNVSVTITKLNDMNYTISAKLEKSNAFAHDPNKGFLSAVSFCLDKFHNNCNIVVTSHGLFQKMLYDNNKFMYAIHKKNVSFENLVMPNNTQFPFQYFTSEPRSSEKTASVLCHLTFEKNNWQCLFHNHAGSARSFLTKQDGTHLQVPKRYNIPDIVFKKENKIVLIESKNSKTLSKGDQQLLNMSEFENLIHELYPSCNVSKGLCVSLPSNTQTPKTNHPILYISNY
jgi:hypothetical protein